MNLLYDFYGQLLTKKQRAFFDLYYQADLSLGEIAAQHDVTRQAVYDILKRSERTLEDLEQKLGLVEKHLHSRSAVRQLEAELEALADEVVRLVPDGAGDGVTERIRTVMRLFQSLTDADR